MMNFLRGFRRRRPVKEPIFVRVFEQSKANGGIYIGHLLPAYRWQFPSGWLSKRREEVRDHE